MRSISCLFILLLLTVSASSHASATTTNGNDEVLAYLREYYGAASHGSVAGLPSFSRQTGLSCSVCHTSFPQLTAFGRDFKMNGYTLLAQPSVEDKDSTRTRLRLGLVSPISMMLVGSVSRTARAQPDAQNASADFPQEMSVFVGGSITPNFGGFVQVTYEPGDGTIAMDNVDLRLASRGTLGSKPITYGLTLNNNPSVQDVWNTAPAWLYPYTASAVAPGPTAATVLDGGLGQTVAGLGGYLLYDNLVYAEVAGYRSAPQGSPNPPDAESEATVKGLTPYWRVALQHNFGGNYLEVGTFGLVSSLYPSGVSGPTDRFTDLALDAQLQRSIGQGDLGIHGIWIHEKQRLDASFDDGVSSNPENTLRTLKLDASYLFRRTLGLTAGVIDISGTTDNSLYAPDPLSGSRDGRPNSTGLTGEVSVMPWLNTRIGLQYVWWTRFNGGSTNYDGAGRAAGDNDTLYLYTWLAF